MSESVVSGQVLRARFAFFLAVALSLLPFTMAFVIREGVDTGRTHGGGGVRRVHRLKSL